MNVIDQAFVKAYSRRTKPQSAASTTDSVADRRDNSPSPDVSVHPQAAESAVVWVDAIADQYLRRDTPHRVSTTPQVGVDEPRGSIANRTRGTGTQAAGRELRSGRDPHGQTDREDLKPQDGQHGDDELTQGIIRLQALAAARQSIDLSFLYHSVIASGTEPDAVIPVASPTIKREPVAKPTIQKPSQAAPAFKPFTALWEVDCFEFSDTVTALFGSPELMKSIGAPLDRAVSEGLQTLLITSAHRGAGQTSVATGIALSAAAAGLRVVLVDAATPSRDTTSLADALNLDVQQGWPEAIRGGNSVAETAIHSIEDQMTVIPQTLLRAGNGPTADEFSRMIQSLRTGFDLVVIDGPPCREPAFAAFTALNRSRTAAMSDQSAVQSPPIDAVILVQDVRNAETAEASSIMDSLKRQGITGLGLVENFT